MFIKKYIQSLRFRSFSRCFASIILLLTLSGNHMALALPPARPLYEPVPAPGLPPLIPLPIADEPKLLPPPDLPSMPVLENARALPADVAELPELEQEFPIDIKLTSSWGLRAESGQAKNIE